MKAGTDSVGVAIPFTAGIALSMCLMRTMSPHEGGAAALAMLIVVCIISCLLTLPGRRAATGKPWRRRSALTVMLFAAGVFVMLTRGIWADSVTETPPGPISSIAMSCSQRLKALIDSIPYSDSGTAALVKALLTGDRSGLGHDTKEAFRASGASHLLALSGMHLGIIYLAAQRLLSVLGNGRPASAARSLATISLTGFFTLMTGAGPSIVRAFLFICINETAVMTGRAKTGVNTLCIALFIQSGISPESIASTGFQLSYLAMTGIMTLYPAMKNWYPDSGKHDIMKKIWNAAALSISCQAFTAPAVWYHFGTFPQYFILTNLLAIPLTTLTMTTSIAVTALSAFGICPDIMVTANEAAVSALLFTLETISRM